jgi:hypothetical protein
MSHHYSGPAMGFPHGDARLDVTDLFAFPKPDDSGKAILVFNVHPSFSLDPPQPTTAVPFASNAVYEFKIDTNGDTIADIAYRIRFSPFKGGAQTGTVRYITGADAAGMSDGGQVIFEQAPVSLGEEALISEADGHRFFAGWRSDPFFFDPIGALDGFHFTGRDFFSNKDICSIALEVPHSVLGSKEIGLWVRTLDGTGGRWVQADRGARPAQSVFLPGDAREAYLAAEPVDDFRFVDAFAHSLEHTGGYAPEDARRVARTLLPDILRFDTTKPASYPENGRALTDDVLDHFLSILTNRKFTTDGVGPHSDLLARFPFLGPPHTDLAVAPSARSAGAGALAYAR